MGTMNVAAYAFTMLAARMLGPQTYGALASLMAAVLVIGVLQLGLQATAARRIAAEPERVAQIERSILRVTYRAALTLGTILLIATPLVDRILRLDSWPTAALVAVIAVPMTVMGGQAGILQGERRWTPLAWIYVASGVPRLILGTIMIAWQPSEWAAMTGVTISAFVPVLVGMWALRGDREHGAIADHQRGRVIVGEIVHNSQALLAFLALSNADVIVARNVLSEHEAGLYAGGLILAKAVLFLPQFVVVIAFPSMSTAHARRQALIRSVTLVGLLGAVCTAGAWLLPDLAMTFVGGDKYVAIEDKLWLFAVLGTALSMLQLLVYSVLARRGQRSIYAVWIALALLVTAGLQLNSVDALLRLVVTIDVGLLALMLVSSLVILKRLDEQPHKEAALSS